jgi:hypothetical protein
LKTDVVVAVAVAVADKVVVDTLADADIRAAV